MAGRLRGDPEKLDGLWAGLRAAAAAQRSSRQEAAWREAGAKVGRAAGRAAGYTAARAVPLLARSSESRQVVEEDEEEAGDGSSLEKAPANAPANSAAPSPPPPPPPPLPPRLGAPLAWLPDERGAAQDAGGAAETASLFGEGSLEKSSEKSSEESPEEAFGAMGESVGCLSLAPDLFTYNAVLDGLGRRGDLGACERLLVDMEADESIQPDGREKKNFRWGGEDGWCKN